MIVEQKSGVGQMSTSASRTTRGVEHAEKSSSGMAVQLLLRRARQGNAESIGELLVLYRNYLTLLATTHLERRLQPRVTPSDVVQETILKAHRHFGQFEGRTERELLAWLRQILLSSLSHFVERHVLTAKRDMRKEVSLDRDGHVRGESAVRPKEMPLAHWQTPSSVAQKREAATTLFQRLEQLPGQYRTVLLLRNVEGLSFEEVAERIGRAPGATRMLWLRAIEKLRELYRRDDEA